MKRKTAIARALLHDPGLLILDEPNSGLDPLTALFILGYLKKLKSEGKTIVLSAHNLFHVEFDLRPGGDHQERDRMRYRPDGRHPARLGKREYQVIFRSDQALEYERLDDNYVYRTDQIGGITSMLETVSQNKWGLVDLSMKELALEEIYVKLMAG